MTELLTEISYVIVKNPKSAGWKHSTIGGTYQEHEYDSMIRYLETLRKYYPENEYKVKRTKKEWLNV